MACEPCACEVPPKFTVSSTASGRSTPGIASLQSCPPWLGLMYSVHAQVRYYRDRFQSPRTRRGTSYLNDMLKRASITLGIRLYLRTYPRTRTSPPHLSTPSTFDGALLCPASRSKSSAHLTSNPFETALHVPWGPWPNQSPPPLSRSMTSRTAFQMAHQA